VSLDIPAGRFVGIIGNNGSGKSTLLKIMAGVLAPDAGHLEVRGTLAALLELGLGFHNELTVHENVVLYGTVLGYSRRQIEARAEEAIAFAGLERFRDAKLKSLSTGMLLRLAFATALRTDADILLLDEVLAVGDVQFQRKCLEVFADLKRQRRTIVLVSHDVSAVQRFCETVFWLDKGRLVMAGEPGEVVGTYLACLTSTVDGPRLSDAPSEHRFGDGRLRFVRAHLEGEDGRPVTTARAGSRLVLRLEVIAHEACSDPVFGFIVWHAGQIVYGTNTVLLGIHSGTLAAGDRCQLEMSFVAGLANGRYSFHVAALSKVDGIVHDWINHLLPLVIEGSRCGEGVVDLGTECRYDVVSAEPRGVARVAPTN
jgi:ABC-type polysaccharide/polyol phosphate transport system ATPase subunit